jgi:hypothetical protein
MNYQDDNNNPNLLFILFTVWKDDLMNEQEIRALPSAQLVQIKEQLLNNKSDIFMAQQTENRVERLEASVSMLIAAFKAEEEAVQKVAEEEEADKMVPISKIAEEEAAPEKEEKEEEEEKDDEKLEKLEAAINQLARYVASKGKQTPDTPEDEPAMTTHKVPKISNEPVDGGKMLKNGDKVNIFQTPAMKPGKIKASAGQSRGESTSFTGATSQNKADVEQKAVDEIFGFAASRGVVPMHNDSRIKILRQ